MKLIGYVVFYKYAFAFKNKGCGIVFINQLWRRVTGVADLNAALNYRKALT